MRMFRWTTSRVTREDEIRHEYVRRTTSYILISYVLN